MIIRVARISHAGDILQLEEETWREPVTTKWDMATCIRFGEVIVAYEGKLLVGALMSLVSKKGEVYVIDIFVARQHRRCGVARKLYQHLFHAFPGKTIITDISVHHREAHALHETLGFTKTKLDRNWYGLGADDEPRLIYQYSNP